VLRPRLRWGRLQRLPRTTTSKEDRREGTEKEGRELRKGRGEKGGEEM